MCLGILESCRSKCLLLARLGLTWRKKGKWTQFSPMEPWDAFVLFSNLSTGTGDPVLHIPKRFLKILYCKLVWFLKLVSATRHDESGFWSLFVKIIHAVATRSIGRLYVWFQFCECTFYNFEWVIFIVRCRIHLISISLSLVCGHCIESWCAQSLAKRTLIFYAQILDRE